MRSARLLYQNGECGRWKLLQRDGAETVGLVINVCCIRHICAYESRLNVTCRLIRSVEWNFMKPVLWSLSVCLSVTTLVVCAGTVLLQMRLAKCGPEMIRTQTTEIVSRIANFWGVTLHRWMSRCRRFEWT
jgi:hypothetical protein